MGTSFDAIGFVWGLLLAVVVPVTAGALFGRWLDARWHTSPWCTLVSFFLSLALSLVLLLRLAKRYTSPS